MRTETGKAERLFRAVVSAFCSLTRPSRREIAQLEDLTLPLFDSVSPEALRFAAAALSECEYAPAELVKRLCGSSVDIAAPLLIRSRAVTDVDLIALIGHHGLPHARAIARRKDLNPVIADLIKALEKPTLVRNAGKRIEPAAEKIKAGAPQTRPGGVPGQAAEDARYRLRSMMAVSQAGEAAGPATAAQGAEPYARLRETALSGNGAFFETALADALQLDFARARSITAASDYSSMLVALRALDIGEDKAFLIAVAVFPALFPHPQAIRVFLDRYRLLHHDAAMDQVRGWRTEALPTRRHDTANSEAPAAVARKPLRA